MKKLNELIECKYDIPIKGIKTDSRKVSDGDLFIAIKGYNVNHKKYIDMAIENHAAAIISDEKLEKDIPNIQVEDPNKELLEIIKKYYDNIEEEFSFIGITGTDGKTTTATITAKLLDCCYVGTNGISYKDLKIDTNNTTPEICEMYEILVKLKERNCKTIVMEISSEALLHGRVDNFKFDITAYTNITEDHLNIHKNIKNYIESKKKLFKLTKDDGLSILNMDDKMYNNVKESCKVKTYNYGKNVNADFKINEIDLEKNYSVFKITKGNNEYKIKTNLLYEYNLYNITLAFAIAYKYGIDPERITELLNKNIYIEGRGEQIDFGQKYSIILDYAHTYNGIKSIVSNVKEYNYTNIIVVTGQAGGREKEKRSKIGKFLLENTDLVIFTMDDPRNESVDDIIDDMISTSNNTNYYRINDRKEAIYKAFDIAKENDIVLILGKGRDNYMAIGNEKIDYSDYETIRQYFN